MVSAGHALRRGERIRIWTGALNHDILHGMPATIETYPDFEEQVRELVEQHRKSKKQRLRLAVYFRAAARRKARYPSFRSSGWIRRRCR